MTSNQLTPRESDIYKLVAEGLTNKEIGAKLGISHNTVSVFMVRIFMKLGYTRRNQIILAEAKGA